ncbi:MAG: hypothetical protein LBK25_07105 [Treponema sp.]|nr:hypothetical protein [Treponema sp.]
MFTSAPFGCFKGGDLTGCQRCRTTNRFRLLASVTVKTGTAAPPFGHRPVRSI